MKDWAFLPKHMLLTATPKLCLQVPSFQSYICFLYLIDGSNKQPILVEKLVGEISLHDNVSCICRVQLSSIYSIFGIIIEFWKKLYDTIWKSCPKASLVYRFLDEIQTKVLRVSSLLFTVTSTALPWDFYFFKLKQPLYDFNSSVTVHCKGERRKTW